jgi:thymidylate synthase (FAD)
MKIVGQRYEVLEWPVWELVEEAGRTCYKSEHKIEDNRLDSAVKFSKRMLSNKHLAMIEFASMTVKFVTDRGVSHELVRHRLCSFAQESTRYCNYSGGVTFVRPSTWDEWTFQQQEVWTQAMREAETHYCALVNGEGAQLTPQQARSVLPNSLKTEVVVKANIREWLHIFELRCSNAAHPDMRELMTALRDEVYENYPWLEEKSPRMTTWALKEEQR